MKALSLLLAIFLCSNLCGQNTFVFLGSFNWEKEKEGLFVYELDTVKGNLSKVTAVKNVKNPSFLTLSADGKYVFACTDSKTENGGSVSSFKFNPKNKSLSFINSQKSGGENPVYLTAHNNGKWLVNGNYTEGSVSVYPVSEDGKIQPFVQNFQFSEGSVIKKRQDRAHIHSTVFSPDFNYIFLPDLGADKIRCYQFNKEKDEPLESCQQPFIKTVAGSGPRHFAFHPNGNFAYVIEEMGGAVSTFQYKDGELKNIQRIFTHSEKLKADFESSDIHISPDGKFLYASNRGAENNIAIFAVENDGTLKTVGYHSTKGKHPRVFGMDETGKFVIVANTGTGRVVVFRRNSETGMLKKVGRKIKIENVSAVQIRKY
ncbi:lactonase family protein [Chryseobacterium caseinilyticum]|uniref:Lactonase family protein n=1 Tax=Chryseobacterium caseinilyticum TaxID=2771428 RepID=A0ABR8Z7W1_9FLAO|nr:lactonase family protein [Chryseobacterium caseinilyticum]MBD8080846.1 lactonase family protein [Chryseobacterium caseinilyticum]